MKDFSVREIELSGSSLIQASAGTGKTYSIALLFVRLVLSGIKADSILTVTFTNAATSELKGRVINFLKNALTYLNDEKSADENKELFEIINDYKKSEGSDTVRDRLASAGRDIDNIQIFTIHGFCKRIISENAFETGTLFNMDITANIDEIVQSAVESFWRREIQKIPKAVLEEISPNGWFSIEKIAGLVKGRRSISDLKILPDCESETPSWETAGDLFNENERTSTLCQDLVILFKRLLKEVNAGIEAETEKTGVVGFDDLLKVLESSLNDRRKKDVLIAAMKKKYKAVLIDEFQDTDVLQYQIFKTLFDNGHHALFFIGDPKQAIYSFRNADVFAYLKAGESVAEEKRFTMNLNFRSSKRAVNAVSRLFDQKNPFEIEGIEFPKVTSSAEGENALMFKNEPVCGLGVRFMRSDKAEPFELSGSRTWKNRKLKHEHAKNKAISDMCSSIIEMLESGSGYKIEEKNGPKNIKPSDIAVLVNSNNDAELVKQAFSKCGIPFVMASNASIFESEEAVDVETVLEAVSDFTPGRIKAALLTKFFGMSIAELETLSQNGVDLEKWYSFFSNLNAIWEKRGFLIAFSTFLESMKIYEKTASGSGGERRLTNVRHLVELIHRYENENGVSPESTLRWLKEKMIKKSAAEEEQLRLESDDNAVIITTIHKSKGITYSVVFCPDLWRKAEVRKDTSFLYYHDENGNTVINFDMTNEEGREKFITETLSENLRLVYVALTRAKYLTVVYWGNIYGTGSTPFAKLFHGMKNDADLKSMSDDIMMKGLLKLAEGSDGSIKVTDNISSVKRKLMLENGQIKQKGPEVLQRKIAAGWSTSSFSSITSHHAGVESDSEYVFENRDTPDPVLMSISNNILSFPAGVKAGVALHSVFEKIDFAEIDNRKVISEVLDSHNIRFNDDGIDMTDWVHECVNSVLDAVVFNGSPLRKVKKDDIVTEMEFFYRTSNFNSREVMRTIGDMVAIPENRFSGFIRGFMDLVFRLDGKYYLVDWKSNRLGDKIEDYDRNSMTLEMKKHNYVLQYSLYLAALDAYLEKKDKNYKYERDFGGVYYFFIRGVTPSNNYSTGIYKDVPEKKLLDGLKKILNGKPE
ncbi:MAG TPA: UvrD-helicase domain-containing protein [bacterium]|nr:UvrD-helicase domain-containing protein [bacterium]HPS29165.1 UvrD-helicase domain-containing protein [bacterium]